MSTASELQAPGIATNPLAHTEYVRSVKYGRGHFEIRKNGVTFLEKDDEGKPKPPTWICSPLRVLAKTRDNKSGDWGRLLEWHDDDGVLHQWAMPLEILESDGSDLRRELARLGVRISPSRVARELLVAYLKLWPVEDRARCVDRLGWHGQCYITPAAVIGSSDERVVFQNAHAIEPALCVSGSTQDWCNSVAALAAGNSRIVFAISVAFASTLAAITCEDSGGFHLRGKSSTGKSTALKAAASVWGDPSNYLRQWRATANGLEGLAALHNDGLLILDELEQVDPREAGEIAYMLGNGQGKARASRTGTARTALRWRLLFLSSGENSLSTHMSRIGKKTNAGQEIRLADFDADAGCGMGVIENLHGYSGPAATVLALKDASVRCHGTVGLEWLQFVVTDRLKLAELIQDGIRQFVSDVVPIGATGQAERVARRFGLVAVAGELASHYGLTGWSKGESEQASKKCFESWLEGFGCAGNKEERAILSQVRAFFQAHSSTRFEPLNASHNHRVNNRAGFYREHNGSRQYLVFPEAFRQVVCVGLDHKMAERVLVAHGWIEPGGDNRVTQKPRLPGMGTAARLYVFTPKIWEADQ